MWDFEAAVSKYVENKLEIQVVRVCLDNKLFGEEGLELLPGSHPESNFVWCFGAGRWGMPKYFGFGHTVEAALSNFERKVAGSEPRDDPRSFPLSV